MSNLKTFLTPLLNKHGNLFFNSEFDLEPSKYDSDEDTQLKTIFNAASITIEELEQHGGEGQGEDYYTVYKFTNGTETEIVKFQGSYYSYDGSTFDSWFFAKPVERMVTVYEHV